MKKTIVKVLTAVVLSAALAVSGVGPVSRQVVNAQAKLNYKKMYADYITKHGYVSRYDDLLATYDDGIKNDARAAFIYIDGDDIPELYLGRMLDDSGAEYEADLFTIYKGKVRSLYSGGHWIDYKKKGNWFTDHHTGLDLYYRIKNGKIIKNLSLARWNVGLVGNYPYEWNGKKISKKKFKAIKKKYFRGEADGEINDVSLKASGLAKYFPW